MTPDVPTEARFRVMATNKYGRSPSVCQGSDGSWGAPEIKTSQLCDLKYDPKTFFSFFLSCCTYKSPHIERRCQVFQVASLIFICLYVPWWRETTKWCQCEHNSFVLQTKRQTTYRVNSPQTLLACITSPRGVDNHTRARMLSGFM